MKKKFTFLIAALFALMLITLPGMVMGQSDYSSTYTTGSDITLTPGSNSGACVVVINNTNYSGVKCGTSSKQGSVSINVPANTKYLHLHVGGYTGKTTTLAVTPSGYSNNISITDNSGFTGNSPYTFNGNASSNDYYKVITFANALETNTILTFSPTASSGDHRFVIWGVNAEEESTATLVSIALSGTYPTSFYQGDAFSHEGMTVTATYDDESSANVTSSATFSGYNMSTLGNQTVTVSYTENNVTRTQTYSITVNAIPCYTVTLSDDTEHPLTEASAGAGVTLPSRSAIGDYSFFKWSGTNVSTETTTAPTSLIPAGTYYPTSDITLYPVYTRTESGSSSIDGEHGGDFLIYADVDETNYYAQGTGSKLSSTTTSTDATTYTFEKPSGGNYGDYEYAIYTMVDNTKTYITYSSSTNLGTSTTAAYKWTLTSGTKGTWRVTSETSDRALIYRAGTTEKFGGYSTGNVTQNGEYYDLEIGGTTTTYYWSSPTLPAVAKPEITAGANPFLFSTTATITCETTDASIKYSYDSENWSDYTTALTITETKTVYAKAIKDANESSVATLTITKNLAEPTVTVSGDLTLDLDGETSVAAGTLSAAVTYDDEPVEGATVTWGSNHTEIATIDASTGAVTLLTTGEVTFTATYVGNSDYSEASGTKTVTIINSKAPGTVYNPYTVAQAKLNTPSSGTSDNVYVHGIVSSFFNTSITGDGSNYRYYISDDGTTSNELLVFKGKGLNEVTFSNVNDLLVGDIVTIYGGLTTNKGTKEIASGNYLISVVRPGTGSDPATIAGTVVDFTIAGDENYIVASNTTLTVTGTLTNNGTAANLTIEDGGQLVHSNTGVQATIKKHIDAADWDNANSGWNFIASPMTSLTINNTDHTNLISGTAKYDLYTFDQSEDDVWQNYKQSHFTTLNNGTGYLYAREEDIDIEFVGELANPASGVFDLVFDKNVTGNKQGVNLVGNPYPCNATVSGSCYVINGNIVESVTGSVTIAPCTGVIVKASDEGQTVTFTKAPNTPAMSHANNNAIELTLTQAVANTNTRGESVQTLDNAIVSFNEGSELGKFYFGTQNANIYIPMDNEEYAIVSTEARGEMPVNFKAAQDGQYTITVNPENVEMGYLHLIDNIAGTDVDLLANPSYTFNAKSDDYESRFRLVFSANNENQNENEKNFAFFSNGQLIVTGEGTLHIIDMMGRVVSTEVINGTSSKAINAKAGVYVLRLTNGENVKTQKIVVK